MVRIQTARAQSLHLATVPNSVEAPSFPSTPPSTASSVPLHASITSPARVDSCFISSNRLKTAYRMDPGYRKMSGSSSGTRLCKRNVRILSRAACLRSPCLQVDPRPPRHTPPKTATPLSIYHPRHGFHHRLSHHRLSHYRLSRIHPLPRPPRPH